jgi:phage tail P2-like protein
VTGALYPSLLPNNSTALELSIEAGFRLQFDDLSQYAERPRTLWDPYTCPASELPLLAWALSVDVYEDWWPESRKRHVVAESRQYHSTKTTDAGIRTALGYRDATLVRVNKPRQGFFADVAVSQSDEAAWLAGLPEIRIYDPAPVRLSRRPWGFAGVNLFARGDARLSRTAVLIKDGVETQLRVVPLGDPTQQGERIVLPVRRVPATVVGRASPVFVVAPVDIGVNTLVVRTGSGDDFTRPLVTPGDTGSFVQSRRRQVDGTVVPFTAAGRGGKRFVAPSTVSRGYLSLSFSDSPGRRAARKPLNVVGKSRVMRNPFTANFLVDWRKTKPKSRMPSMTRVSPSSEPLVLSLMSAVMDAKAARDGDTITLSSTRSINYSDIRSLKAGTKYGDRRGN